MFLAQPEYGGWCLFQNGSTLDTYRMLHEHSLDFMNDAFSSGLSNVVYQESVAAFRIDPADPVNVEYLNYFSCGTKSAANVFTCHNYQPNWTDLGETNGYPRFGRLDPVKAGYINAGSLIKAPFYDIRLFNGASSLAAAFALAISFLAF